MRDRSRDGAPVINARIETVAEKPLFRDLLQTNRCLVPADGFYEWKKDRGGKRPYRIGLRDGGVFTMAGLWSRVHTGDGSEHATCAIVTIPPNDLMKGIHDRMPALIQPEDLQVWLDPKASERDLLAAMEPYPASSMRAYEVSTAVNSPARDLPDCIRPIDDEQ